MLIQTPVQTKFNNAATTYDSNAIIQKKMADELLLFSKEEAFSSASILELGCGTGMLTKLLHRKFPHSHIHAIDIAENMLRVAQSRLASPNITFTLQDIEAKDWKPVKAYDFIVSNAVLQWLKQPQETIQRLVNLLQPSGWIAASTFGPATFQELSTLFSEVEKKMGLPQYNHHLPMKSADEWEHIFNNAGIHHVEVIEMKEQLYYQSCRQFLQSIKAIGASISQSKHPLIVQKKVLQEVMKRYDARYRDSNGVYATYHVVYLKGQKCI